MILSSIRMKIPPQKRGEALKILRAISEECPDTPGCFSCHVYEDLQELDVLMVTEVWKNEEDMNLHLRSDVYRNLLMVMEMAIERPEIRFDTISNSMGVEAIEKARVHA